MGASFTSSGSRVVPTTGDVVSREIAVSFTFTVSPEDPGCKVRLTVEILATSTVTWPLTFLNPLKSAATEYVPGSRPTTVNAPIEVVVVFDTTPVDVLMMVTFAPGITAPLESATVPLIPACTWAWRLALGSSRLREARRAGRNATSTHSRMRKSRTPNFCVTPQLQIRPYTELRAATEADRRSLAWRDPLVALPRSTEPKIGTVAGPRVWRQPWSVPYG